MKWLQLKLDKLAIGFSSICIVHCLAVPLIAIIVPAISPASLSHLSFHLWILAAVLPTSLYALILGYKQHRKPHIVILGSIGILILCFATYYADHSLTELEERILTIFGSLTVALAHLQNFKCCRTDTESTCRERKEN